jgi:hypothetical protein
MAEQKSTTSSWQGRLAQELGRDKKKTAILTVLIFVGLFVVGKTVLRKSSAKTSDTSDLVVVSEDNGIPETPLAYSRDQQERLDWNREVTPIEDPSDLFAFRDEYYESLLPPEDPMALPGEDDPAPVSVAVEPSQTREQAIQQMAANLELQSVISSGNPVAVINGSVVAVGEFIDGFEVVDIGISSCTVRREGVDVQIAMPDELNR